EPASRASSIPRENPPEPPRFAWSINRSRPPSDCVSSAVPGSAATFRSPWSITQIRSTTSSTSGACARACNVRTQKSGLFTVVIPMVVPAERSAAVGLPSACASGTSQRPASSSTSPCASTSNQSHPPDSNPVSARDTVTSPPVNARVVTAQASPSRPERLTTTRPDPVRCSRRVSSRTAVYCTQYVAGKALKYVAKLARPPAPIAALVRERTVSPSASAYNGRRSWSVGRTRFCTVVTGLLGNVGWLEGEHALSGQ